CAIALPWFNQLAGKIITTSVFSNIKYLTFFLLLAIVTGLLSGIYPAFFLSGFQPVIHLRGTFIKGSGGNFLRRGLVVTQFAVSIILIVATIIIYRQLNFMRNEQLGFKKEH